MQHNISYGQSTSPGPMMDRASTSPSTTDPNRSQAFIDSINAHPSTRLRHTIERSNINGPPSSSNAPPPPPVRFSVPHAEVPGQSYAQRLYASAFSKNNQAHPHPHPVHSKSAPVSEPPTTNWGYVKEDVSMYPTYRPEESINVSMYKGGIQSGYSALPASSSSSRQSGLNTSRGPSHTYPMFQRSPSPSVPPPPPPPVATSISFGNGEHLSRPLASSFVSQASTAGSPPASRPPSTNYPHSNPDAGPRWLSSASSWGAQAPYPVHSGGSPPPPALPPIVLAPDMRQASPTPPPAPPIHLVPDSPYTVSPPTTFSSLPPEARRTTASSPMSTPAPLPPAEFNRSRSPPASNAHASPQLAGARTLPFVPPYDTGPASHTLAHVQPSASQPTTLAAEPERTPIPQVPAASVPQAPTFGSQGPSGGLTTGADPLVSATQPGDNNALSLSELGPALDAVSDGQDDMFEYEEYEVEEEVPVYSLYDEAPPPPSFDEVHPGPGLRPRTTTVRRTIRRTVRRRRDGGTSGPTGGHPPPVPPLPSSDAAL
ncbi:hypothetical protein CONPUDRAFT_72458 [Coniophora puteana RWD-64-598 SS2]|uniref:Uncharacterized protein n=1 Tax=Coniophora puteana (strain RWD-64-598) TaxID=741705 RepID=A0A5M3MU89_CONPW|nr:uncharacterized protein CONPUDRAFT_72458 [Coniophora puteana RWD-64-598 SS2]EIW82151.1 hypothetical protein CONPUDRAFT_72458 [Coniophora puteana RWD-64-598 SS2]